MALSVKPTRAELRTQVRYTLMDPNARWWSDTELNGYLDEWQHTLQSELEATKGAALSTIGPGTSTINISTDLAEDILRVDAIFWNNQRLVTRSETEMDTLRRDWRTTNERTPGVVVPIDSERFELWPPAGPAGGYLYAEYPRITTFATDTSTSILPAWCRWSANDYCAYKAFLRHGPNQDINRATRYRALFERKLSRLRTVKNAYLPKRGMRLTFGDTYEADILLARRRCPEAAVPPVNFHFHKEEEPSGVVNGTNAVFTLSYNPNPDESLQLFVDGVLMEQGTHYALSGSTATFSADYIPVTGQSVFAVYRYSV